MAFRNYVFVNDQGNRSQTLTSFGLLLRSRARTVLETPDGVSEPKKGSDHLLNMTASFFDHVVIVRYCSTLYGAE